VSGFSQFAREAILRASAGGPALTLPAGEVYLALLTAEALDSATGSTMPEAAYPGYARVALLYAGMWEVVQEGTVIQNAKTITGPTLTGGGEVHLLGWATCDAPTAGQMLWSGTVPMALIVSLADPTPVIPPGVLQMNLASGV
jgi:hypothetical protein